ncbi:YqaA family protein [Geobacter sulfurreducens]|uniref:YqaA family protein n=1 Tax=Geobacter sulfurreducens TaxID=35554 RepID=UPI000DBB46E5|nr:YqaA family protein [Geobacter sulfurreducens]BBA68895.1 Inner membrane protein YqaA [Geobacter sulfurreducens]
MEQHLAADGLITLFVVSFLAATLIPVGSEWLLVALLTQDYNPLAVTSTATVGNIFGACTTWAVGMWGGVYLVRRILRISEDAEHRAEQFYRRYGYWSLLLSWLPILGDPLCLVGGILRVGFGRFVLLVGIGKLARYSFIAWVTVHAVN